MTRWLAAVGGLAGVAALGALTWALTPASGAEGDVTAAPGAGQPRCPAVEISGGRASGGCVVVARKARVSFTATTLFGEHRLARCSVGFKLRVGGAGELSVTEVFAEDIESLRAYRLGVSEACGDILVCRRPVDPGAYPGPEDILPWSGRLVASGQGLTAELDACFDTCLGRFEGPLSLDLAGGPDRGWRLAGRRAALGESGFEISGAWELEPAAGGSLAIEAADRGGS